MNGPAIRIAVTGANGQLGKEFRALQHLFPTFEFHFFSKTEWDIAVESVNTALMKELKPDVVINAAAYTNVEKAEEDVENAMAANALGPGFLAAACKAQGSMLIHISTDYVFDGKKKSPYTEEDDVRPLNLYGKSKLEGERAIDEKCHRYFILRTSWLYSSFGHNFYKTMLRLAREKGKLSVVNDQYASPTYAAFMAADIVQLIHLRLIEQRPIPYGIYHYTQSGVASWYDFAREIMRINSLNIPIEATDSKRFPTKAVRPEYSKLSTVLWEKNTSIPVKTWQEGVRNIATKSL